MTTKTKGRDRLHGGATPMTSADCNYTGRDPQAGGLDLAAFCHINRQQKSTGNGENVGIDTLLAHLDKVKKTGQGRWLARCPAHDDKAPSLSVRGLDDGRILVHCFSGCAVQEVVTAIGLDISDLFPQRAIPHAKAERRPFPATDILRAVAFEALVVATSGASLLAGQSFTEADRERLMLAVSRIQSALTAGGLNHG